MSGRLKKDILVHLTEVASEFRRHADASLAPTTKRLLLENFQLNMRVTDMYREIRCNDSVADTVELHACSVQRHAFSALTLLVGRQERHPACRKNRVVGCWRGYLSGARCRLAYGPADATATHCLLLQ